MTIRSLVLLPLLGLIAGCDEPITGPITVSAIGGPPQLVNPNLQPLDPPAAFLAQAVAQGLVRFDSSGEIEPALAQSWIVSDDGLRYTFRIRRTEWPDGRRVTAKQVVSRLQAAISRASRNPLKPILGSIASIEAMTDDVLEITLVGPRPNFLQLLAQPQMAIILSGVGTGPYQIQDSSDGVRMALPAADDADDAEPATAPDVSLVLHGEPAPNAIARFLDGDADLVVGGTLGTFPYLRAAEVPANTPNFDPVAGLFGLSFGHSEGLLGITEFRRALAMAVDRDALVAAFAVPRMEPRVGLLPAGLEDQPQPGAPDWAALPLDVRRREAAETVSSSTQGERPLLRIAMPDEPGYRRVFAMLRRDWRLIGVDVERVANDARADLRLLDAVAPAAIAPWHLRHFTCDQSAICSAVADAALASARTAPSIVDRRQYLAEAEQALYQVTPFIPLATPVRWSLAAPRLTGFRPNMFARHPAPELIAERR